MHACVFSCVQLFAAPWTVAHKSPLSMRLFRQEYWSGFLLQGIFLIQGSNPGLLHLLQWQAESCHWATWEAHIHLYPCIKCSRFYYAYTLLLQLQSMLPQVPTVRTHISFTYIFSVYWSLCCQVGYAEILTALHHRHQELVLPHPSGGVNLKLMSYTVSQTSPSKLKPQSPTMVAILIRLPLIPSFFPSLFHHPILLISNYLHMTLS